MNARPSTARDEGSVLILVLVMMVIGSLVVLPLLNQSSVVFRANTVLSQKTANAEAARAGLRVALADPVGLYQTCNDSVAGLNTAVTLNLPELNVDTTTKCYLMGTAKARDNFSLPYAQVSTYVGSTNPVGAGVTGTPYPNTGAANENQWLGLISKEGAQNTVWLPDLPVHALTARSSTAYAMPAGYPTCNVYFPGTYRQPVVINGPTYFTSGIYYFEDTVTVAGGAKVVAGQGTLDGCTDDQFAVFYATNAPPTHNINGLGTTFVFGDDGRLVFNDAAGVIDFKMNQRYVQQGDLNTSSSALVSIMTVNGDLDPALAVSNLAASGIDLKDPGKIDVPLSYVSGVDGSRPAPADQYRPSTLTPAPRAPGAPTGVTGAGRNGSGLGAVAVSWVAPSSNGGSPITGYTVKYRTASSTAPYSQIGCETVTLLTCLVPALTLNTAYSFVVEAVNAKGVSAQSTKIDVTPRSTDPTISNPSAPTSVSITQPTPPVLNISKYVDAFTVNWVQPASLGNSVIKRYDVTITDGSNTWACPGVVETTSCTVSVPGQSVTDIVLKTFTAGVTAIARKADGSDAATTGTAANLKLNALGATYVAPAPPAATAYVPPAVVDVALTTTNKVTISIPGYIAAPQGVVRVSTVSATDKSVSLAGGVISAWSVVTDPRPGTRFDYGLLNPATQRIVRLVTTVANSPTVAEAVVQVNETGAWAVNSWSVQ